MEKIRCIDCFYFEPFESREDREYDGTCHRRCPQVVTEEMPPVDWIRGTFKFPSVYIDDWCGDAVSRPEEEEELTIEPGLN